MSCSGGKEAALPATTTTTQSTATSATDAHSPNNIAVRRPSGAGAARDGRAVHRRLRRPDQASRDSRGRDLQPLPTRAFDTVTFAELADYWWQAHGSKDAQPGYLYPQSWPSGSPRHHTGRCRRVPGLPDHGAEALSVERESHRTILNGIFNFAVKRGRFDRNPVAAVRQRPEPPGRDRIVSPAEFRKLWDKAKGDGEMRAFLALAGTRPDRARSCRCGGIASIRRMRSAIPIVRKITGHRSRELERYQHLTPELRALTVNLIATELFRAKRARKREKWHTYRHCAAACH